MPLNNNTEILPDNILVENSYFKATSNNLLASIDIQAFKHNKETYQEVLNYINHLFKSNFPLNHQLNFEVKEISDQNILSIPCFPDHGANRLFNSVAQYHDLHQDIESYINIVENGRGFYTDFNDPYFLEIEGFAIFSLILEDSKYAERFINFLHKTNNHTFLQNNIPYVFLDRQGISSQSVRIFLKLIESLILLRENFSPNPNDFFMHFNNVFAMKTLLQEVNAYIQDQQQISTLDILLSLVGFGNYEDFFHELYAMKKFKSREIWKIYLELAKL